MTSTVFVVSDLLLYLSLPTLEYFFFFSMERKSIPLASARNQAGNYGGKIWREIRREIMAGNLKCVQQQQEKLSSSSPIPFEKSFQKKIESSEVDGSNNVEWERRKPSGDSNLFLCEYFVFADLDSVRSA